MRKDEEEFDGEDIRDDRTSEELILRHAEGDDFALRVLYSRHAKELRKFVTKRFVAKAPRLVSRRNDVLNEVWIGASNSAETFREEAKFKTWLFAIAVRVCANYFEAAANTKEVQPAEKNPRLREGEPDRGAPVPELVHDLEIREDLDDAVSRLPEQQRVIFHLREEKERGWGEIVERLAIPVRTAKRELERAKAFLAFRLARHAPPLDTPTPHSERGAA